MSTLFSVLGIAGSGIDAMQTWLDTSAGNIANANDVVAVGTPAYAPETTVLAPSASVTGGGTGVGVAATVRLGSSAGVVAYEPGNPLANGSGEVVLPDVSLSGELVDLIQAQEGYQASTSVVQKAIAAYQSGLAIGS